MELVYFIINPLIIESIFCIIGKYSFNKKKELKNHVKGSSFHLNLQKKNGLIKENFNNFV